MKLKLRQDIFQKPSFTMATVGMKETRKTVKFNSSKKSVKVVRNQKRAGEGLIDTQKTQLDIAEEKARMEVLKMIGCLEEDHVSKKEVQWEEVEEEEVLVEEVKRSPQPSWVSETARSSKKSRRNLEDSDIVLMEMQDILNDQL